MPRLLDKILLNCAVLESYQSITGGYFDGIHSVMEGCEELAQEISDNNWLDEPEAKDYLKRQEAICKATDGACEALVKALAQCHKDQTGLADEMRLWIDKKLNMQKLPTP